MDETDLAASPRKKVKLRHTVDGAMDDSTATACTESAPKLLDQAAVQHDKEVQCGITESVHSSLHQHGFTGVLKKRYTDFLVNEILPSGLVVHLKDMRAPRIQNTKSKSQSTGNGAPEASARSPEKVNSKALGSAEPQLAGEAPRVLAEPDPVNRIKHNFIVRETAEGIEEVDQDKEDSPLPDTLYKGNVPNEPEENVASMDLKDGTDSTRAPQLSEPKPKTIPSTTSEWNAYAGKPGRFELSPKDRETLTAYFEVGVVEDVIALYNRILHSPKRRVKEYGSVKSAVIRDRAIRTKIHQDLRRIFLSRLESMTDNYGSVVICAMAEKPQWGSRQPTGNGPARLPKQNKRPQWKELGGDYLHFTLYKENKDTMEAISWLSRQLKLSAKSFQFAGTKDRRGVTVQRVSVHRVLADRMIGAGRTLKQAKIGDYEYQPQELHLGDLLGNEFIIALRDCHFHNDPGDENMKSASAVVDTSVRNLCENGFINYYGLQRFGTFSTRTDSVGIKMLQGDFKGAVDAILDFNPASLEAYQSPMSSYDKIAADDQARAYAIQAFRETGKSYLALATMPRKFSAESSIIRHLSGSNRDNDYQGALSTVPRNLRLMYVHAYQSLVWNVMAGLRWKEHGNKVAEGDLVLVNEHVDKPDASLKPEGFDADGEPVVQPDEEGCATNKDDLFERARTLTKEEADSGKYTIFDVVLPTPGYDILYPANGMEEHYRTFMASERGGGLDPQGMRRGWKDTSLSGSYRKLLARPMSDVSFELKLYFKDDEQFIKTDLDKMSQGEKPHHSNQCPPQVLDSAENGDELTAPEAEAKKKLAVILKLQLRSGQYATMALRELMGPGGLQTYKPDYGSGR